MPFQRVPDTVEIVIDGVVGGQACINTHYAQMVGGYTIADIENLASDVDAWVTTWWLPQMPSSYHYNGTQVRGLNAAIDIAASDSTGAADGALAPSTQPNNCTLAVSRRSANTGRGARGRIYIPPPAPSAMADENHITDSFAAALVNVFDALDVAVSGAGFVPVIVHRVASGVPLAEAVVFTIIEWVVVDKVMDSMRRRLPGRGA